MMPRRRDGWYSNMVLFLQQEDLESFVMHRVESNSRTGNEFEIFMRPTLEDA